MVTGQISQIQPTGQGFNNMVDNQDDFYTAPGQPVVQGFNNMADIQDNFYTGPMPPVVRGFNNIAGNQNELYTAPVHSQYWSGSQGSFQQYPVTQGYFSQQQYPQQYYGAVAHQPYPQGYMAYPKHAAQYPGVYGSPLPKRNTSKVAKTLLGAVVVGTVARALARGK